MKKLLLALLLLPAFGNAQNVTFWTEDFGAGCGAETPADNYFSFMTGFWTVTSNGVNVDGANDWFISATENGNDVGECGTGCGDDRSLHLGAVDSFMGTDIGAAYYEGLDGFCDLIPCGATNKRAESPNINCSGMANIVLNFNYIEGGNAIDNATIWYYDGISWSLLADPDKTPLCPNGQGTWTAFSIPLPFSSNNNTTVKIGFQWINNDDGDATDPSFAVDDIFLTGDFGVDVVPPVVLCPIPEIVYTEDFCAILGDYAIQAAVFDDVDPFPTVFQTPETGNDLSPGSYEITITAIDNSGNQSQCSFEITVIDDDAPVIQCPQDVNAQIPASSNFGFVGVPVPTVSENCGDFALLNDFNNLDNASGVYPLGSTVVNFTATDDSGNSAECFVTVNVTQIGVDCCLGDFNCDGFISVTDMLMLLSEFGCVSGCATDLDNNGIVGAVDMQIFTGLYGTTCP